MLIHVADVETKLEWRSCQQNPQIYEDITQVLVLVLI